MSATDLILSTLAVGALIVEVGHLIVRDSSTVGACALCGGLVYHGDKYHTRTHAGAPVHLTCEQLRSES